MLGVITIGTLVSIIVTLVVLGCIVGLLAYWINKSPIPEPYKGWIRFVLLTLVILVLIGMLLQFSGIYDFRGMR
jgi:ribose/xylose/arabinose/galactoside ABC-type transport system permease subunit